MTRPINLYEFEVRAREVLGTATFDYIAGGAADEISLRRAGAHFSDILLRPRVMVDVETCRTDCTVLGQRVPFPVLVAPSGDHGIAHPDGELATAAGVAATGTVMVVSSGSTRTLEEISAAADGPRWLHLPLLRDRSVMATVIARAEASGYTALCLTVDHKVTALRERNVRNRWVSPPPGNFEGLLEIDSADWSSSASTSRRAGQVFDRSATWHYLDEVRGMTRLPVVAKGVLRGDDARLAIDHGAAAVIVSDHGARQLDTAVGPIQVLSEVVDAVGDTAEVYLDGGIRRGTDVLKALALGARAVLIGRPVMYGLAVEGAGGVSEVLRILAAEFGTAMAMCGCADLDSIGPDLAVVPAAWEARRGARG